MVAGCSRQPGSSLPQEPRQAEREQTLPFDQRGDSNGIAPSSSLVPALQKVPAGTPLTIRLRSRISSTSAHSGDTFDAVLDEPVNIQGQTVIAHGAAVKGRVVLAKRRTDASGTGYLRLTLSSLTVNGKVVPIHTSSIFGKSGFQHTARDPFLRSHSATNDVSEVLPGNGYTERRNPSSSTQAAPHNVVFSPERRLSFRLTEPVSLQQ